MLSRIDSKKLAAFVVWVPHLQATSSNVREASRLIDDPRTIHYWDGADVTGAAFEKTLHVDGSAWDIYLAYAPGVQWDGPLPPSPTYWMHQSGYTNAPPLDPDVFAQHVNALLAH